MTPRALTAEELDELERVMAIADEPGAVEFRDEEGNAHMTAKGKARYYLAQKAVQEFPSLIAQARRAIRVTEERDAAEAFAVRAEELVSTARWIIDDSYETEDGQACVIDLGTVAQLREAFADWDADEKPENKIADRLKSVTEERDRLQAENARYREMDEGRIAGLKAHQAGIVEHANPHPHFGPDSHRADAWDTGWHLSAGNEARTKLSAAESENARLRARVEHLEKECDWRDAYIVSATNALGKWQVVGLPLAENIRDALTAATARIAELERANQEREAGAESDPAGGFASIEERVASVMRFYKLPDNGVRACMIAMLRDCARQIEALQQECAAATEQARQDRARHEGEAARMRELLQRIVDTDTHGKNVRDELGLVRPTGRDFCGRCNRNSWHPHASDCPIQMAIDAARLAPSAGTAGEAARMREALRQATSLMDRLTDAYPGFGHESQLWTEAHEWLREFRVVPAPSASTDGAKEAPAGFGNCSRCGTPWRTWGTDADPVAELVCDGGHSRPHPWKPTSTDGKGE